MRDWLHRQRIDRTFLIWLVILLMIFPILLGLVLFGPMDLSDGNATETIGYSLIGFLVAAGLSLLYMAVIGLPIALLVWIAGLALLRPMGLGPRASAILSAIIASVAMMLPFAFRIGGGSSQRTMTAALLLGLIPGLVSALYFHIAYRGATWEERDGHET